MSAVPATTATGANQSLAGKRVAITGASGGIGAACATACASAGAAHVALIARTEPRLHTVATLVTQAGADTSIHAFDVTNTPVLIATLESLGPLDVLINSAGTNQPEPLLDVSPETFERLWRLNVQATYFGCQAAARSMREHRRPGVIINLSSQMGHVGAPLRSVYCATKFAVEGLTRAIAVELAQWGIRVVAIAPTFIHTAMTAGQLDDPAVGPALLAQIPLGQFGAPQDVADAAVFLASDKARMITGESLKVDGGWTAR
jgi:NAD(P)-dependent dehydrogenase (short-subunit alcohol dehydrogenase family)